MSAEEAYDGLYDRAVRHRIGLEGYAESEVRDILRLIQRVEQSTMRKVFELQADPELTRGERARLRSLEGLLREIRLIYAEGYAGVARRFIGGLDDLAEFEAEFQTASLNRALDDLDLTGGAATESTVAGGAVRVLSPTAAQLRAVVRSRPLTTETQSGLLDAWVSAMTENHIKRAEDAIRIGFVEGESVERLAERIRTVSDVNKRGAEALARTALTHVAAEVAQETYTQNADLVQEVEWISVLDTRTTPICITRDGQRWPLDTGPRPPAHIRCRSTLIPILEGFPRKARPSFGEWLARQPAGVQDEALGKQRGALFRRGGLKVDRFTTPEGRLLTLDQLRAREANAFRRAGL